MRRQWQGWSNNTLREVKLEEAIETWQIFCNCDEPGSKLEKNQSLGRFCSCCAPFTCCTDCNVHVVDQTLWSHVITIFLERLCHLFSNLLRPIALNGSFPFISTSVNWSGGLLVAWVTFFTVSRIRSWGSCGIGRGALNFRLFPWLWCSLKPTSLYCCLLWRARACKTHKKMFLGSFGHILCRLNQIGLLFHTVVDRSQLGRKGWFDELVDCQYDLEWKHLSQHLRSM